MDELFTQVAQQVQGVASQSNSNLEQTVNRLLQRTARWSNDTATGVANILTDHARVFEERMGTLLARLDTIVAEMGRSTQSGSEQLSATVNEVVVRLEQTMATIANIMQGTTNGVLQQTGNASAQFRADLNQTVTQLLEHQTASQNQLAENMARVFAEHAQLFESRQERRRFWAV